MRIALIGMGVPGAGKSTLLKPLAEKYGMTYVNRDSIRKELFGSEFNRTNNQRVWEVADARATEALSNNKSVILDATFAERPKRARVIKALRSAGAERIIGLYADTPLEVALERNRLRERVVEESVIREMHESLQNDRQGLAAEFDIFYTLSELHSLEQDELLPLAQAKH